MPTAPELIVMVALGLITYLVIESMGWFKKPKTTEFDSPKDDDYFAIGAKLNNHNSNLSNPTSLKTIDDNWKHVSTIYWGGVNQQEIVDVEFEELIKD